VFPELPENIHKTWDRNGFWRLRSKIIVNERWIALAGGEEWVRSETLLPNPPFLSKLLSGKDRMISRASTLGARIQFLISTQSQ
jgi:hypothetical protein